MKIPGNVDLGKLTADLRLICQKRIDEGTPSHQAWLSSLDTSDAYLLFFLGQLSRKTGRFRDTNGWTRILARLLEQVSPFYSTINSYLIERGIVEFTEGKIYLPDVLARRKGYRLTPDYANAATIDVPYDPDLLMSLLRRSRFKHVDPTGQVSITVHQLQSFADDEVEAFLESTFTPVHIPQSPPTPYSVELPEPTPEEAKEEFAAYVEDIIAMGQSYDFNVQDIREAAEIYGIAIINEEIAGLLEPSEKKRKAEWEETLRRFGKKPTTENQQKENC